MSSIKTVFQFFPQAKYSRPITDITQQKNYMNSPQPVTERGTITDIGIGLALRMTRKNGTEEAEAGEQDTEGG